MTEITTDKEQEYCLTFNAMTEFLRSLGLTVKTNTKARGHQGFFLKNRIDISASIPYKRKIEVLIHEFTHYIHAKIDPEVFKNHGTLESLFPGADIKKIQTEMLAVTRFVDTNKSFNILNARRNEILEQIKQTDKKIKSIYPDFKRSYAYPKFEKIIKKTDAKYLLKYDKVRVKTMFTGKTKDYSIKTVEEDFPQFEEPKVPAKSVKTGCFQNLQTQLLLQQANRIVCPVCGGAVHRYKYGVRNCTLYLSGLLQRACDEQIFGTCGFYK